MRAMSMSASGEPGATTPALFTTSSSLPNAFAVASNIAMIAASSLTSPLIAMALLLAFCTAATVSSAASAFDVL